MTPKEPIRILWSSEIEYTLHEKKTAYGEWQTSDNFWGMQKEVKLGPAIVEFPPGFEVDNGVVGLKPALQSREVLEYATCDITRADKTLVIDLENQRVYVEEQSTYLGTGDVRLRATYQWRIRGFDGEWHYFWDTWSFKYVDDEKIAE